MFVKKKQVLISYPLTCRSPLYPNTPPLTFQSHKAIQRGDSSNSSILTFSSHSGTHIDLPLHFCEGAPSATDLLNAEQVFNPVFCIDLSDKKRTVIQPEDLAPFVPDTILAEALLLKTGMSTKRDTQDYIEFYPYIDPEVPTFLREHFPQLKIFCIDTLSISNPAHRTEGHACHRNFLCKNPAIMIMEDVNLSEICIRSGSWKLKVYPFVLDNLDAVPVVAILEKVG